MFNEVLQREAPDCRRGVMWQATTRIPLICRGSMDVRNGTENDVARP